LQLIFLFGPTASGKLTVAQAFAARRGFKLFHRHLVEDMASAVFDWGSSNYVRVREYNLLQVFREAVDANYSLVFTFLPERTTRESFISHTKVVVERLGGEVVFVELTCPEAVIEARITNPDRRRWGKVTDVARYRALKAEGAFSYRPMPTPQISIDTSAVDPDEAARRIDETLGG
jgi:chloramphenicol 3-O-phosphotransferase